MSKTRSVLFAAALCSTGTAFAQDPEEGVVELSAENNSAPQVGEAAGPVSARGPLSVYGGARLGFGGQLSSEDDDSGAESDEDLLATIGLQAGADYVLWDYVAVGGELRLAWFNTETRDDNDIGRDMQIDIAVKPRGRYAFGNLPLEVYGTLPLGITFINTNGDIEDAKNADISQGPGFNLGVLAGGTYFFMDKLGVNGEMGYLMHWFGSDVEIAGTKFSGSNFMGQFSLFANVVYAL